jgi:hypothetical protein
MIASKSVLGSGTMGAKTNGGGGKAEEEPVPESVRPKFSCQVVRSSGEPPILRKKT